MFAIPFGRRINIVTVQLHQIASKKTTEMETVMPKGTSEEARSSAFSVFHCW